MIHSVSDRTHAFDSRSQWHEKWPTPYAPKNHSLRPRILVGDDDRAIRPSLGEALRKRGFSVLLAADGEADSRIVRPASRYD